LGYGAFNAVCILQNRAARLTQPTFNPRSARADHAGGQDRYLPTRAGAAYRFRGGIRSVIEPCAISAAKQMVSLRVGWGWMVRPMSS